MPEILCVVELNKCFVRAFNYASNFIENAMFKKASLRILFYNRNALLFSTYTLATDVDVTHKGDFFIAIAIYIHMHSQKFFTFMCVYIFHCSPDIHVYTWSQC